MTGECWGGNSRVTRALERVELALELGLHAIILEGDFEIVFESFENSSGDLLYKQSLFHENKCIGPHKSKNKVYWALGLEDLKLNIYLKFVIELQSPWPSNKIWNVKVWLGWFRHSVVGNSNSLKEGYTLEGKTLSRKDRAPSPLPKKQKKKTKKQKIRRYG